MRWSRRTADGARSSPSFPTVRLETDDPLAELNDLSQREKLVRFHVERPTLEQVFLNLTGRTLRD